MEDYAKMLGTELLELMREATLACPTTADYDNAERAAEEVARRLARAEVAPVKPPIMVRPLDWNAMKVPPDEPEHDAAKCKPVEVYDIDAWLALNEVADEKGYPLVNHEGALAILVGPEGVLVWCHEGVAWHFEAPTDTIPLVLDRGTYHNREDGKKYISTTPTHTVRVPLQRILDEAPYRSVPMVETVRVFGDRLETNFTGVWKAIVRCGLDPADYHPTRHRTEEQRRMVRE